MAKDKRVFSELSVKELEKAVVEAEKALEEARKKTNDEKPKTIWSPPLFGFEYLLTLNNLDWYIYKTNIFYLSCTDETEEECHVTVEVEDIYAFGYGKTIEEAFKSVEKDILNQMNNIQKDIDIQNRDLLKMKKSLGIK